MSDTLFPIAPEEPQRRRSARRAPAAPEAAVAPEPLPAAAPSARPKAIVAIGEIDDEQHPCDGLLFDRTCAMTIWDIFYEDRGEWLVGCHACGKVRWMPVVPGHLPDHATFRVHGGRFDGLTFDQIAALPRGLDTINLYANDAKKPTIQREARKWLDARTATA